MSAPDWALNDNTFKTGSLFNSWTGYESTLGKLSMLADSPVTNILQLQQEARGISMPTASPTASPTVSPTVSPTASPTVSPTASPPASPEACGSSGDSWPDAVVHCYLLNNEDLMLAFCSDATDISTCNLATARSHYTKRGANAGRSCLCSPPPTPSLPLLPPASSPTPSLPVPTAAPATSAPTRSQPASLPPPSPPSLPVPPVQPPAPGVPTTAPDCTAKAFRVNTKLARGNNFMAAKTIYGHGSPQDMQLLNRSGFTSVRIGYKMDERTSPAPDHIIPDVDMREMRDLVDFALAAGITPIVNPVHNWFASKEPWTTANYAANLAELEAIWTQVGAEFASYSTEEVVFEMVNEPHEEPLKMPDIYAHAFRAIRSSPGNQERVVIAPGDGFSTRQALIDTFDLDELPASECYVIGTFHYYDPRPFTKQGAAQFPPTGWGTSADFEQVLTDFRAVETANLNWANRNGASAGIESEAHGSPATSRPLPSPPRPHSLSPHSLSAHCLSLASLGLHLDPGWAQGGGQSQSLWASSELTMQRRGWIGCSGSPGYGWLRKGLASAGPIGTCTKVVIAQRAWDPGQTPRSGIRICGGSMRILLRLSSGDTTSRNPRPPHLQRVWTLSCFRGPGTTCSRSGIRATWTWR